MRCEEVSAEAQKFEGDLSLSTSLFSSLFSNHSLPRPLQWLRRNLQLLLRLLVAPPLLLVHRLEEIFSKEVNFRLSLQPLVSRLYSALQYHYRSVLTVDTRLGSIAQTQPKSSKSKGKAKAKDQDAEEGGEEEEKDSTPDALITDEIDPGEANSLFSIDDLKADLVDCFFRSRSCWFVPFLSLSARFLIADCTSLLKAIPSLSLPLFPMTSEL